MEYLPIILVGIGLVGLIVVALLFFVFIRLFTRIFTLVDRLTGRSDIDREHVLDSKRT